MKTITPTSFARIDETTLSNLTVEVKETVLSATQATTMKPFTTVDLWKIQRNFQSCSGRKRKYLQY